MNYLPPTTDVAVGPLQYECLLAIWKHGPSSVHVILDELNEAREPKKKIAYTTVLTVVRNLLRRKVCTRVEGTGANRGARGHVYAATRTRAEFETEMARQFIGAYFGGEVKRMLTALKAAP